MGEKIYRRFGVMGVDRYIATAATIEETRSDLGFCLP
jgi:hypothetical protein